MSQQRVLFVDDETNILKAIQRLLRAEPVEILTAQRPEEALALLERTDVQLVVSDHPMPGMSGADLLSVVRERHPDIVRVMMTGYTHMDVAVEAINRGEIYRLITKPWNDDELRVTLKQALDHYTL
ncbi:response regulator, partial [Myxococcota bacterium]|nr:response regulator [Myxococcota bacterium]